jgi:hypothetical protein
MGMAQVKLVQEFGVWNNGLGPNNQKIKNNKLDLTSVFMSTVLHVHLQIENKVIVPEAVTDNATAGNLISENSYSSSTGKLKVGDKDQEKPLAEIDIAGPNYDQYDSPTNSTKYPASTAMIPAIYATYDAQGTQAYQQNDQSIGAISGVLTVEYSVVIYACAYPTFDGTGQRMVHDPTFSIYVTIENPGVMAIILVVGVVALVGIAAVLITKKKNATVM